MTFFAWIKSLMRHRKDQRSFEERMARLAQRDVADTVAEEDVHLIVALLEAGEREARASKRERSAVVDEAS
jgi:hypothetical protein